MWACRTPAAILYVDANSTNPVPPYADWSTAATNIQDAVDASTNGDEVLVTNGVYQAGGRYASVPRYFGPILTNRVTITNAITLQSVNGPAVTSIVGRQVPGTTNDAGAIRCVYLAGGATLSGFTLTNGATGPGGSDAEWESWGGGVSCPANDCVIFNCIIINNSAGDWGGGANGGNFYDCRFSGNNSGYGGGAYLYLATASNCVFEANSAWLAGGALEGGTVTNCIIRGNSAPGGGGADFCTLYNCALSQNSASGSGGGLSSSTAFNCTLTGNAAPVGGGADGSALNNCVVYYNHAPNGTNFSSSCALNYSCTTPLPDNGTNNITDEPMLADDAHLAAGSPCIGAGSADFASGVDIDGEAWGDPPSIGCDEYYAGASGPLSVSVHSDYTNVADGFPVTFSGSISGHADYSVWDFGDGTMASNQVSVTHSWFSAGIFTVTLTAFNADNPAGVSASETIYVLIRPVHLVNAAGVNPIAPYLSWDTAATNIQDAVDAAFVGGTVVVTNGVYDQGGRVFAGALSNRLVINRPMLVISMNGPAVTTILGNPIMGDSAVRCACIMSNAILSGFNLRGGATRTTGDPNTEQSGGGVWCQDTSTLVSNCWLTANSAVTGGGAWQGLLQNCELFQNSAGSMGGGAEGSVLESCALSGNSALSLGGAVEACTLSNCTVTINSATDAGGGADASTLYNCIVFHNTAAAGSNYNNSSLNFCCTSPSAGGVGNITNEPLLADTAHLQAASPCIGAGSSNYASGTDIDIEPWASPPSMGCDEYHAGPVTGFLDAAMVVDNTNVASGFVVNVAGFIHGHAGAVVWNFGDGTLVSNVMIASHSWTASGNYPVTMTAYNDDNPGGVSASMVVSVLQNPVYYVSLGSLNPVAPYSSWATAATNIQDAVDAAFVGGTVLVSNGVYQTGGRVDARTGNCTNRVVVAKPISLMSVSGPATTVIQGNPVIGPNAVRCLYLTNNAVVTGFTLSQGANRDDGDGLGGAVWGEAAGAVVSNCFLFGNAASGGGGGAYRCMLWNCVISNNTEQGGGGGGAYDSVLNNCLLVSNSTAWAGGGANGSVLNNCLIIGNSAAWYGGGAAWSTLGNCTVATNFAPRAGSGVNNSTLSNCIAFDNASDNFAYSTLNYCCTIPDPGGVGNVVANPVFVNEAGGDFHLAANSPCINSGKNDFVALPTDLDGNPRISGETVDLGAYEFQNPASIISYYWLQQHGMPKDGSADHLDPDGDGMDNWQEWRAGTDPANAASRLAMLAPVVTTNSPGVTVSWQSVSGVNYYLLRGTDLSANPAFSILETNIAGQGATTSLSDTSATNGGPYFYRVGVQ